ncbi:MAG: hypothetical protein LBW85_01135 [Deltaproteobacteria bacterium]|jgi:hypothetical protein|nr:hypothetical protein [Deltaproteobacteria bacterium]
MTESMLTPPATRPVRIGGETFRVGEIRPCDVPPLTEFLQEMDMWALKTRLAPGSGPLDVAGVLGLLKTRPAATCRLMAALLDPDPLGPGSEAWREEAARSYMCLPASQITEALGAWAELNASFFARAMAPLITAAVAVLAKAQMLIDAETEALRSSSGGNA